MTDSSPGPGRHRAAGYNADIPGISIFHAIVFHSPYPPVAGLFTLLLTLFGLLLVTFSLSALSPVDRVLQIVGDHASQSTYDQVRHQLGLDQPLPVQFWHYLVNLAMAILASPALPASRCSTTCWRSFRRPLSWRPWR
ncbi:putative ABC transport system permease component [Klebsiella pneumoniae]|uniref:Putative ABC transport system permease component n=1 Tax=Klebsiella pneumoniae TaxID=573 RepID=A0A377WGR0_KLEPN|nr:putative ABC transport system permease component [Klebsiella pneumoniae]